MVTNGTAAEAREISLAAPDTNGGTTNALGSWQEYPPAERTDSDPLAARARELSGAYGVPEEAAVLACCCAVSAAAGNAFHLRGPGQLSTPSALHALLVSPSPTPYRLMAADAFDALAMLVRGSVAHRGLGEDPGDDAVRGQAVVAKIKEAKKLRLEADADRAEWVRNWGEDFELKWDGRFRGEPPLFRTRREEADRVLDEAAAEYSQATFDRRPVFLTEGAAPLQLMDVRELSADGSVFDLDIGGGFWPALAQEPPAKRRALVQRLAAGWNGAPRILGAEVLPASTMGTLGAVDPAGFAAFRGSKEIREGGLRRMVFVGGGSVARVAAGDFDRGFPEGDRRDEAGTFNRLLLALFRRRTLGGTTGVKMGKEAEGVFLDFVADVGRVESDPGFAGAEFAAGAADHARRFALLLHLGAGKKGDEEVGEDTMRRACALAAWGVRCGAGAIGETGGDDSGWEEVVEFALRVRSKGKARKRDIYRSYHDQRRSRLEPIMRRAVESGLVSVEDDGSLVAAA